MAFPVAVRPVAAGLETTGVAAVAEVVTGTVTAVPRAKLSEVKRAATALPLATASNSAPRPAGSDARSAADGTWPSPVTNSDVTNWLSDCPAWSATASGLARICVATVTGSSRVSEFFQNASPLSSTSRPSATS